jgi:N6-adenosine-specific RNA methylase IME4
MEGIEDKRYEVIVADPPWKYDGNKGTPNRLIENHYETMPVEDIMAYPVRPAKDAILFLWATPALLPYGFQVMKAWGFTYKTNLVWDKVRLGSGYWVRVQHEHVLIGIKGEFRKPPSSKYMRSVLTKKRGKHSEKPEALQDWIDRAWPEKSKCEYFARRKRLGWDSFGNEVEGNCQSILKTD